jgi:hypothetical protein
MYCQPDFSDGPITIGEHQPRRWLLQAMREHHITLRYGGRATTAAKTADRHQPDYFHQILGVPVPRSLGLLTPENIINERSGFFLTF